MSISEEQLYKTVGKNIKLRRRELSYTQEELGHLVGIGRTSIGNMETGLQRISLHLLYLVSEALQISIYELLPKNSSITTNTDGREIKIQDGQEVKILPPKTKDFLKQILANTTTEGEHNESEKTSRKGSP